MTLCLALEDVEALYLGPSFLTADPMGPLLDHEDEEALSPSCYLEGKAPASPPSLSPPPLPLPRLPVPGYQSLRGPPPLAAPRPDRSRALQRTKPYSKKPEPSPSSVSIKMKSVSGAPKVVEKKLKKMEQNKTAATRYRQKKRVEQDLVSEECEELMKKNEALEERAEAISREIKYLTELMEEVRRRRTKGKAP